MQSEIDKFIIILRNIIGIFSNLVIKLIKIKRYKNMIPVQVRKVAILREKERLSLSRACGDFWDDDPFRLSV